MRRAAFGLTVAAVVVALSGATAAYAFWQVSKPVSTATVVTGDIGVQATWQGGTPNLGPLWPGSTTTPSRLDVVGTGTGNALRWKFSLSAALPPGVTMAATRCDIPEAVTGTYPPGAGLLPAATVPVCIAFTVAQNAPASLQSALVQPVITVNAIQVRP